MQQGFNLLSEVFFALCKSTDTPVSLGHWLRFQYGEFHQLANASIDPMDYLHADAFRVDYQIVNYIRKYEDLPTGIDKRAEAIRSFVESEQACQRVNKRLAKSLAGGRSASTASVFHTAQLKIAKVLGPLDHSWAELCKWGPGATYSLSGDMANSSDKLTEPYLSVTPRAVPYARVVLGQDLHWLRSRGIDAWGPCTVLDREFRIVPGSRVVTVPKDSKTDRTIAIEPTLNTFLQGGVGLFIRDRLYKQGINLRDQMINQNLASRAYAEGLATVDLSSASDSISEMLVHDLLPPDWANLLDDLRSPNYQLDGEWFEFSKHSSMGNSYTFELETLIFWALSKSVMEHLGVRGPLHVYGDDIILPSSAFSFLTEVLVEAGFTVNLKKSYSYGPFYESCGEHFFKGVRVTPCFQREVIKGQDAKYRAHNRLVRSALSSMAYTALDKRFLNACRVIRRSFKPKHFIPLLSEGDEGLLVCRSELRKHVVRYHNWRPCLKVLQSGVRSKRIPDDKVLLALALRNQRGGCDPLFGSSTSRMVSGRVPLRGRARSYTKVRPFPNLGLDLPWI